MTIIYIHHLNKHRTSLTTVSVTRPLLPWGWGCPPTVPPPSGAFSPLRKKCSWSPKWHFVSTNANLVSEKRKSYQRKNSKHAPDKYKQKTYIQNLWYQNTNTPPTNQGNFQVRKLVMLLTEESCSCFSAICCQEALFFPNI